MDFIVVVNKTDLPQKVDLEKVKELANGRRVVTTSLLKEEGVIELEEAIAALFFEGQIEADDLTYVSNSRHITLLHQALDTISDAIEGAENNVPVDIVQIDVTRTWEILGEIIGDTVQESLINQLFSQFCLGK
ncbi:5-carboxymethylaminomethyl-2-thiouridylate synthase [Rhizophagus irregularis]|uniref:5-carboxymethylaminomethyl-2-thiouridylate synthase n=1 Tax=Rhizophagus irregularis TaxID=588596 RepID=A0A2N0QH31_9GLOM|nr:5-carboxymethylaminomethyl-2-thiouridylate synthase [Rhizophagus irregularis]